MVVRACPLWSMSEEHFFLGVNSRGYAVPLSLDARRRHMAVFGKSGAGKTTLLANLAVRDMQAGDGVCVLDPHGDLAQSLLDFVPKRRTNSTIYFNPSDRDHCPGLNLIDNVPEHMIPTAAAAVIASFSHIFELSPSTTPRLLHYLRFSILALLHTPNTTLAHLPRMLSDNDFRYNILRHVQDPAVREFWEVEFENNSHRYNQEAAAPMLSRIKAYLAYPVIRNIIGQAKSTFNVRQAMDDQMIFIANLAKGELGEEASNLLGSLLISEMQLAAMSRVDVSEDDRADFRLIVDEYTNFTTSSFANLLSEARKMRVSLTLAGQYTAQANDKVFEAIAGNVGAMVVFRVGASDAEYFAKEFGQISSQAIVDLSPYCVYSKTFDRTDARVLECYPYPKATRRRAHLVMNASRQSFTRLREKVERQVEDVLRKVG